MWSIFFGDRSGGRWNWGRAIGATQKTRSANTDMVNTPPLRLW
jgi:hypothetical protein